MSRVTVDRQHALVQKWKDDSTYPYVDEPTTHLQQAEQQTFDVVALSAARILDGLDPRARKFSLHLVREALESNPTGLRRILTEVLDLPSDRIDELARLLDRTTLSTLISTSRKIGDRLDFLAGLNALVFDTESNRQTLERRQLHRILAEETWIFAEEYALTGDDDRLLQVLRGHAEILGDDIDFTDSRTPPRRADGREAIPDLVLSRKVEQHQNRIEHIVIELKRPKIDIGVAQINQIESYALAVLDDPRFTQANVFWDFWVVGVRVDKYAEMRRNQDSLPHGFIQRSGRYSIQVRTWAEVIGDAEHRLKFVARNLEYRSSRDQGIQYLRDTHSKYLPSALRSDEGK